MEINIRKSIKNNFKESKISDIKESIIEAVNDNDEITLPGLGVFFEILWKNSDDIKRDNIIQTIKKGL